MKYVQNQHKRHQKDVNDVPLLSSLLPLHDIRPLSSVPIVELEQVSFGCIIQHTIYVMWATRAWLCNLTVTK